MYFVLRIEPENNSIVACDTNKINIVNKMINRALDFIRDEEGNKKANNCFVDSVDTLYGYGVEDGHYLIKSHQDNRVTVYIRRLIKGYLTSSVDVYPVFHFEVQEYDVGVYETSTTQTTIPSKPVVNDNTGLLYAQMIDELKEKLESRIYKNRGYISDTDDDLSEFSLDDTLSDITF